MFILCYYYVFAADHSSLEQLEVLYNVRLREIENLRDNIGHLEEKHLAEKSELETALKKTQDEVEKTIASRNEIQKVLGMVPETQKFLT